MPVRTCPKGHTFTKTSDCPTCPRCEAAKKPADEFFGAFAAPARRALAGAGIDSVKKLAKHSEKEILALHGMGRASLPAMKKLLREAGLSFAADAKPAEARSARRRT